MSSAGGIHMQMFLPVLHLKSHNIQTIFKIIYVFWSLKKCFVYNEDDILRYETWKKN